MSVFSIIKRGRQAAKEHNAKQAEIQKKEAEKTPYKHIPRHAAIDALSGGPATWREADRPRILEQNRRRSAMTANNVGMSGMSTPIHAGMPGMPRVNSALSHVSYPSLYASPVVQVPRTYSYNSMHHPGWNNHGGEVVYSNIGPHPGSVKGKEVERVMIDSGRASRSSSKGSVRLPTIDNSSANGDSAASPVESSSNSTSSQDDLEMKPAKHAADASPAASSSTSAAVTPISNSRAEGEYFHRLHPGHSRRISDVPSTSSQSHGIYMSQRQGRPRVASLPPAPSGGIPPVPALPQLQFGAPLSYNTPLSHGGSSSSTTPRAAAGSGAAQDSVSRRPPLAPKTSSPTRMPLPEEVAGPISHIELEPSQTAGIAVTTPTLSHKNKRISKATRFTELETISSNVEPPVMNEPTVAAVKQVAVAPVEEMAQPVATLASVLPTEFDESSLPASRNPIPPTTRKPTKLTKNSNGSKLVKKNRWSTKGGKSAAVAH